MFDKHVSKIILEAAQMLSTAINIIEPEHNLNTYKTCHINHPVSIWVRTSLENFMWTIDLVEAMHNEWKYRNDHPPSHENHLRIATALRTAKCAPFGALCASIGPPQRTRRPPMGCSAHTQCLHWLLSAHRGAPKGVWQTPPGAPHLAQTAPRKTCCFIIRTTNTSAKRGRSDQCHEDVFS